MEIKAYVNHGRWLATCPDCGAHNEIKKSQTELICISAQCFGNGLRAMAYAPKPGNPKLFVPVPDLEERRATRERAKEMGRVHTIVFEVSPEQVDKLLRPRKIENMHWVPGESLTDLRRENLEHGIRVKK